MRRFRRFVFVGIVVFLLAAVMWMASHIQTTEALMLTPEVINALTPPDFEESISQMPDYAGINGHQLTGQLRQIPVSDGEVVTQYQRDELRRILYESIMAYKLGDATMILEDRLRAEYIIRPEATVWHKNILKRFILEEGEEMPEDPEQIMRLLVNRNYYSDAGMGYAGLYSEISILGSRIEFNQSEKMPTPVFDIVKEVNRQHIYRLRNGMINFKPSIEYINSPEKVLKEDGVLQYVDVWLAASNRHGHKYPRFRRYYWSNMDDTWLQMEMVSFYARKRRADPFF